MKNTDSSPPAESDDSNTRGNAHILSADGVVCEGEEVGSGSSIGVLNINDGQCNENSDVKNCVSSSYVGFTLRPGANSSVSEGTGEIDVAIETDAKIAFGESDVVCNESDGVTAASKILTTVKGNDLFSSSKFASSSTALVSEDMVGSFNGKTGQMHVMNVEHSWASVETVATGNDFGSMGSQLFLGACSSASSLGHHHGPNTVCGSDASLRETSTQESLLQQISGFSDKSVNGGDVRQHFHKPVGQFSAPSTFTSAVENMSPTNSNTSCGSSVLSSRLSAEGSGSFHGSDCDRGWVKLTKSIPLQGLLAVPESELIAARPSHYED